MSSVGTRPPSQEAARSLACAAAAQSKILSLDLLPTPRNYEIFYGYAAQIDRALIRAVDELLARAGTPTESDIERLHLAHFASARMAGEMDKLSSGIRAELGGVVGAIAGSVGKTAIYGDALMQASRDLTGSCDPGSIGSTIQTLVTATLEMHRDSLSLQARLDGAMDEISDLQQGLDAIRMESRTDPLTELANRKRFDETLGETIGESKQRGTPLSLLMVDIDHFKQFNDTFGHVTGDQVLRLVATLLKQNTRNQDLVARYGGEEFAIVLPNTDLRQAIAIADQLRRAVTAKEMKKRSTGEIIGSITISVGGASLLKSDTGESFVERADSCLYEAKRGGRNRVVGAAVSWAQPVRR